MKKSLRFGAPAMVLAVSVAGPAALPVFAQDNSIIGNVSTAQTAGLQELISNGNQVINSRITRMNTLRSQVTSNSQLSSADQATLTGQLDAQIAALGTLKAKLDAETTLAAAQSDLSSMYATYRNYDFVTPKLSLLRSVTSLQNALTNLQSTAQTLQTELTANNSSNQNLSNLQSRLDDAKAKILAAQTQLNTLRSNILSVQAGDYNTNPGSLGTLRSQLFSAQVKYRTAQAELQSVRASLFWSVLWF